MVLRLSELLERIRPAGAPGAPTEGEVQRRDGRRASEIETIAAILSSFEEEADAIVAAAQDEAETIRSRGHSRVRDIAAALPERKAVAEAEAAHLSERRDQLEAERLQNETDSTISRLEATAEARTPPLVEELMEVIWSQLLPTNTPTSPPP